MSATNEEVALAVTHAARQRLAEALGKIRHCLDQLTDEQVWWRPHPSQNSIANLLLHLGGNVQQWLVAGLSGAPDQRDRPREFAERDGISKAELLRRLAETVARADAVLAGLDAASLLAPRRIQGFDVNGVEAIFDSVPHFQGHTQEIIYVTRLLLGDAYRFKWVPTTKEQGA
jgi:hypothetical protein